MTASSRLQGLSHSQCDRDSRRPPSVWSAIISETIAVRPKARSDFSASVDTMVTAVARRTRSSGAWSSGAW